MDSPAKKRDSSGLMKEAMELETLCGVDVSVVCFDANGKVDIWPQDESEVKKRCSSYLALDNKAKKEVTCSQFLQDKKKKILLNKKKKEANNKDNIDLVISSLSNCLEGLSGAELRDSVTELEAKLKFFKERIAFLQQQQQQVLKEDGETKEKIPN